MRLGGIAYVLIPAISALREDIILLPRDVSPFVSRNSIRSALRNVHMPLLVSPPRE